MSSIRHNNRQRSEQPGGAAASGYGQASAMVRPTSQAAKSTMAAETNPNSAYSFSSPASASSLLRTDTVKIDEQQQQTNGQSITPSGKLVFGLSSRTNKLRHDEYAEKRGAKRDYQPKQQQTPKQQNPPTGSNLLASDKCHKSHRSTNDNGGETGDKVSKEQEQETDKELKTKGVGKSIRASKYGNYYKPQDLVTKPTTAAAAAPTTTVDTNLAATRETANNYSTSDRSKSPTRTGSAIPQQQHYRQQSDKSPATSRRSSPTRQRAGVLVDLTARSQPNSTPNSSQQTHSPGAMKERVEGDKANSKAASTVASSRAGDSMKVINANSADEQQESKKGLPKMQFNIPPPPQLNNTGNSKPGGSVVSYAKSRIYDKPTRGQMLGTESASLLDSGHIPESILSGFKPPKQVNVSKAREKWEGGEPFAKCKSRQRLALQANNKKLLHGFWPLNSSSGSMATGGSSSSVVAMQQMQLQQVMNSSLAYGQQQKSDPPVKILTRGSVLERVQQFEKSPSNSSSSGASSGSSSSSSSGSSSPGSDAGGGSSMLMGQDELVPAGLVAAAAAAASMEHTSGAGINTTEAGLALQQPLEPVELRSSSTASLSSPTGKQATYKTRVSSIQTQTPQDPLALIATNGPKSPTSQSPATSPSVAANQRQLSSPRRRSSSAIGSNNSTSSIPKFYHPNGKPNTYEIELQKKNIVSCFDKFPDRKALVTGPTYRRHFHGIALACGFSEYFKEPLYLYVKHQMTKSNLLHNTTTPAAIRQHRQSGIGPTMINGTTSKMNSNHDNNHGLKQAQTGRTLTRAASIDNSTMEKINNQTFITCEQFLLCWRQMISVAFDNPARFVHLLTLGQRNYLIPDDFVPLIQSIIDDHPGLKFLRSAPDFHMRYIQTVIARIYFCINKSWTGKINLAELRQSNLLAVLEVLSQEEDINQITDYFSYEHFYVIYCKFWNLDQDHDLLISKEDLAKHNDAAISSRIIDRIFMGIVSKQIQATGKMSYSDFVWFLIAEEDKKHPRSIEYWFRLMDIDGDGYISMYEMEYFYYEQMKRLELMNIEALPFIDSACQILDLVNPKEKNKISLADLKRTKMATIFFDTFINLEKYLEHESREFVSTRDVVQDGVVISDWDRYASEEYESLVTEESSV